MSQLTNEVRAGGDNPTRLWGAHPYAGWPLGATLRIMPSACPRRENDRSPSDPLANAPAPVSSAGRTPPPWPVAPGAEAPDRAQHRKETAKWLRRRQLERQLHDGASLRISALTLRLGLLCHKGPADRDWQRCIMEIQDELHAALQELRDVAARIYPPLLDEAGLGPALRELADRRGTTAVVTGKDRFGPIAEGAAYFAIAEWLNTRPAGRNTIRVDVHREKDDLVMCISPTAPDLLCSLLDHARPLGGVAYPTPHDAEGSDPGTITMRIPCE